MQQGYYQPQWYMPGSPMPQQQQMPQQFHPHPPPGPQGPQGMPMSPRNPAMPLQQAPGTPTQQHALPHVPPHTNSGLASITSPPGTPSSQNNTSLPGAGVQNRLSTYANTFVPNQPPRSKGITIKSVDGTEVDLAKLKRPSPGLPSAPPSPAVTGFQRPVNGHQNRKSIVRMESEDARKKRMAEEEAKAEAERAAKEAEEKAKKDAEEKIKREEEERIAAVKKAEEEEAERIRKEEEERVKKEEEEKERIRKEAEEAERLKAEEAERIKQEEAEKVRIAEEEKAAAAAAAQKAAEDEEKAKEAEATKQAAAAAVAAAAAKEKEEGEVVESPAKLLLEKKKEALSINTGPNPEARKQRPGPLDLSYGKKDIPPSLPSALATARIIEDIGQVAYPEGIQSPKIELNVNAKDSKFK